MNQYRLRIEFDKFQRDRARHKFDDAWPWVATLLAFLLAVLPADFQDFLFPAAVWEAMAIILTAASAFMVVRIWYLAYRERNDKAPTPEDAVNSLIDEMGRGEFSPSDSDTGEPLNQGV